MTHSKPPADVPTKGPIAWMVNNRVSPNLLMVALMLGGLFMSTRIKKEVFPEFELDTVSISVTYPGASPEETEQGIVLAVEEAVRGLEGVKEVTATASEGRGLVTVELLESANNQQVYQEIQQEIDRITTFPEEAEEPVVTLDARKRNVMQVQLYGDTDEWSLRNLAEEVRDRLLQQKGISQVELLGVRGLEIHVEISESRLREHQLTLPQVAELIQATAIELPGGSVKTSGGEILVRVKERRDWAGEFARMPLITGADGSILRLQDVAKVSEGFEDSDSEAKYNGHRSVGIAVYRIGKQTPIGVSDAVKDAMNSISADLPEGVDYAISNDQSEVYRQRLNLLIKNAFLGLCLVLLLLGLFLEIKLAFWVTMGIPISFLGALLFLPVIGISINMISMFAFIIALGIVVDDAIIAGENIYEYRQRGMGLLEAGIQGARDVATPIAFSIITNVVAFLPLMFVPGFMGKVFSVIPTVVITVFLISWVESLVILPSHLAHSGKASTSKIGGTLHRYQQAFSLKVRRFIQNVYGPFLDKRLHHRLLTLSVAVALMIILVSYVKAGHIGVILMPRVESDEANVTAVLPVGSPIATAREVQDRLTRAAERVAKAHGGEALMEGIFSLISGNSITLTAYLTDASVRPLSTSKFKELWREEVGAMAGLQSIQYVADRGGPGSGSALSLELSHRDIDILDQASQALAEKLSEFPNVKDIDDGYTPGKKQMDFKLTPEGRSLGLSSLTVARQVRAAFYGAEALRQQRGRNEVKVLVRRPEAERTHTYDIEHMLIRTPAGTDVSLLQVAEVEKGRAYTSINRFDGRRTVTVTADVEPIGEVGQVKAVLAESIIPELVKHYPGLTHRYAGRQADMSESTGSLKGSMLMALAAIYFLLAVPFRSYAQPLIIMTSIPFGIVGAVLGHVIMGYNLSIISMMGMIALSGVVVNDSLVLVDYANRQRMGGISAHDAILQAGIRRFRPILLTTLTTFGGLAPMIFETSRQARFMIPMALSLGYGILFATLISLVLVPTLYLIVEDVSQAVLGE